MLFYVKPEADAFGARRKEFLAVIKSL